MDNPDDHEKNHSLLVVDPYANGRLRLAPAYDVVPTNSGQGHQEFICGSQGHDSTLENALSQCEAFGLSSTEGAAEAAAVIDVVNDWKEHFQRAGVRPSDIESLQEHIDGDSLRSQRMEFTPRSFTLAPARPRKKSPFQGT
jgi:serine/threonine-protein kinase HipA